MSFLPGMIDDAGDRGEPACGLDSSIPPVSSDSDEAVVRKLVSSGSVVTSLGSLAEESCEWAEADDVSTMSHLDGWNTPQETLIMLDWDDTLCPTTYLAQPFNADLEAEALLDHAHAVQKLLELTAGLGRVSIVSMAGPGWVDETMRRFMPAVADTLEALRIPVALARVDVPRSRQREAFTEERSASHYLKRRMMVKVIKKFYASRFGRSGSATAQRSKGRSWKNIVSVGDCEAERLALQDIVMGRVQRDRTGKSKECRCKTIKLKSEPSLVELTEQIHMITRAIAAIINHDGDVEWDCQDGEWQTLQHS